MNLKNGYKVMYEVIDGSKRIFRASTTGLFEDAIDIVSYDIGSFKAVYQDVDHMLYGVDAEGNKVYLDAINALFVEATTVAEEVEEPVAPIAEPEIPAEPEKTDEPEETGNDEIPEEGNEEV